MHAIWVSQLISVNYYYWCGCCDRRKNWTVLSFESTINKALIWQIYENNSVRAETLTNLLAYLRFKNSSSLHKPTLLKYKTLQNLLYLEKCSLNIIYLDCTLIILGCVYLSQCLLFQNKPKGSTNDPINTCSRATLRGLSKKKHQ